MPKSKRNSTFNLTRTEKKTKKVKENLYSKIQECTEKYKFLFLFHVENMRNSFMKELRIQFNQDRFFYGSNRVMQKALGLTEEDEISKNGRLISEQLVGNVGLFFTNSNEDFVLDYFEKFVKLDYARGGAICTESFEVKKGALMRNGLNFPNNMEPMLRKLGLPTELQQGVLVCRQDYQVCKQGTVLTPDQAHLLKHFGVQMAYFKINVIATLNISTGQGHFIKVKRSYLNSLFLIFIGTVLLLLNYRDLESYPSIDNVINHLKSLELIAKDYGDSRSVVDGHSASVDYVLSNLAHMNATFNITTQLVTCNVQVDEMPPLIELYSMKKLLYTFQPKFQVMTATGSGSSITMKSHLVFIDGCDFKTKLKNFIAIIDPTNRNGCSVCDKLRVAIQHGAGGVIVLSRLGNMLGYPHPLQPRARICGKKYLEFMKLVGVVTLSDDASYQLLKLYSIKTKLRVGFKIVSAFREYQSKNIIAESWNGNKEKVVLFGSHLDSVRTGPGINDDGSGAMATLELANYFHLNLASRTKQKIRFAWWTAEEIGLLGSSHYVDELKLNNPRELKRIKLNIDTDMIASPNYVRGVWNGEHIEDESTRRKTKSIHNVIKKYFNKLGLPIYEFEFNGRSDFAPFLDAGIPAGGVITGEDEIKSVESAELFGGIAGMVLDPCYHQDCDRISSIIGPGIEILKQNMNALGYVLEYYAFANDIDYILTVDDE